MMYRIAMVAACPYPVPQGSQVLLRTTAEMIAARGHDVHLVVYGYGFGADDGGLRIHRGTRIPGMRRTAAGPSWGKPVADLTLVATLRRVVREEGIDIVHAHNYEGLLVALAAGTRPIVYHAHNAMSDELPHFLPGGRAVGRWLDMTFPKRADRVIVLHDRLRDYLVECGCAPSRIAVIPPSVDTTQFEAGAVSADMPALLYTGNLDAYQNLDLLYGAVSRVRAAEPRVRLRVATADAADIPGAEMVRVEDLNALRNVLREDVIVISPRTSWSGYPIKLLNAMAAGKPIVACKSASPCLVRDENGLVVEDNDEAGMAEATLRLVHDPELRARLGRNARRTAETCFDPKTLSEQIEGVYRKAISVG